jgi:hypothetical protein
VFDVNFVKDSGKDGVKKTGKGVITVDSGAEESVCPKGFGEDFGVEEVKGKGMNLVDASGGRIEHWGTRRVTFTKGF